MPIVRHARLAALQVDEAQGSGVGPHRPSTRGSSRHSPYTPSERLAGVSLQTPKPTPSPSKLKRLAEGATAAGHRNKRAVEAFYTDASLRQRYALMQHPNVAAALDRLWVAANRNGDALLQFISNI